MAKVKASGTEAPAVAAAQPARDEYTPQVSQRAHATNPPPRLPPGPDFILQAHGERWCVMAGKVIPLLGKLLIQPGVSGVVLGPDKRPRLAEVELDRNRAGWTLIPWDVDGPGTSYIHRPVGTDARLLKWERCFSGSAQIVCDEAGYAAWCESLVERKIVRPAPAYVLERMIATLRAEESQNAGNPGATHRLRQITETIRVIEAKLTETLAKATPAETEVVRA